MKAILISAAILALFVLAASCGGGDDDDSGGAVGDTWSDPSSGLTWQVNPSDDFMLWEDAIAYCDSLALDSGGWHLPTISELRSLIRGCDATITGGACNVTDDCLNSSCWSNPPCNGCDYLSGPGSGGAYWPDGMSGEIDSYWSSSPVADEVYYAWDVVFNYGGVYGYDIYDGIYSYARCVRP